MRYHIGFRLFGRVSELGFYVVNLDEETLMAQFVEPYRQGATITWSGEWITPTQIVGVKVYATDGSIPPGGYPSFNVYATKGEDLTNDYIGGPPGYQAAEADAAPERVRDDRRVMVVHGRNVDALNALRSFLASLGLEPVLWEDAVAETG